MRIFFYMGRNPDNISGVSWKLWKIACKGRRIQTWWGRVRLNKRKILPAGELQTQVRTFPTHAAALEHAERKISAKVARGYETKPRRRRA